MNPSHLATAPQTREIIRVTFLQHSAVVQWRTSSSSSSCEQCGTPWHRNKMQTQRRWGQRCTFQVVCEVFLTACGWKGEGDREGGAGGGERRRLWNICLALALSGQQFNTTDCGANWYQCYHLITSHYSATDDIHYTGFEGWNYSLN